MKKENKIDFIISGICVGVFIILITLINLTRKIDFLENYRLMVNIEWILYPLSYTILFYGLSKLFFCFNENKIKNFYLLILIGIVIVILLPYLYSVIIFNLSNPDTSLYDISTKVYDFYRRYTLAFFTIIGILAGMIKFKNSN